MRAAISSLSRSSDERYNALRSPHPISSGFVSSNWSSPVVPGSLLLDFGCGTGSDSLWYAEQGYRILAYDNAPGMMAELERKCSREIAAGRIVPLYAPYDRLAEVLQGQAHPQAVVSNFAA